LRGDGLKAFAGKFTADRRVMKSIAKVWTWVVWNVEWRDERWKMRESRISTVHN
jgi:hypothetical protein